MVSSYFVLGYKVRYRYIPVRVSLAFEAGNLSYFCLSVRFYIILLIFDMHMGIKYICGSDLVTKVCKNQIEVKSISRRGDPTRPDVPRSS